MIASLRSCDDTTSHPAHIWRPDMHQDVQCPGRAYFPRHTAEHIRATGAEPVPVRSLVPAGRVGRVRTNGAYGNPRHRRPTPIPTPEKAETK